MHSIPGQPLNGYIHWTVAVIPLSSVIAALLCVIAFLLWRLKYKTRKQIETQITVSPMHYDVQTRSILKEVRSNVKNGQVSNTATRVHFQEPNKDTATGKSVDMADGTSLLPSLGDRSIPRRLAVKRKCSYNELEEKYQLDKGDGEVTNKVDYAIMRRLAIRRKNSNELDSKYPLNKSEDEAGEEEKENVNSYENKGYRHDAGDTLPKSPQGSDYKELHEVVWRPGLKRERLTLKSLTRKACCGNQLKFCFKTFIVEIISKFHGCAPVIRSLKGERNSLP